MIYWGSRSFFSVITFNFRNIICWCVEWRISRCVSILKASLPSIGSATSPASEVGVEVLIRWPPAGLERREGVDWPDSEDLANGSEHGGDGVRLSEPEAINSGNIGNSVLKGEYFLIASLMFTFMGVHCGGYYDWFWCSYCWVSLPVSEFAFSRPILLFEAPLALGIRTLSAKFTAVALSSPPELSAASANSKSDAGEEPHLSSAASFSKSLNKSVDACKRYNWVIGFRCLWTSFTIFCHEKNEDFTYTYMTGEMSRWEK